MQLVFVCRMMFVLFLLHNFSCKFIVFIKIWVVSLHLFHWPQAPLSSAFLVSRISKKFSLQNLNAKTLKWFLLFLFSCILVFLKFIACNSCCVIVSIVRHSCVYHCVCCPWHLPWLLTSWSFLLYLTLYLTLHPPTLLDTPLKSLKCKHLIFTCNLLMISTNRRHTKVRFDNKLLFSFLNWLFDRLKENCLFQEVYQMIFTQFNIFP